MKYYYISAIDINLKSQLDLHSMQKKIKFISKIINRKPDVLDWRSKNKKGTWTSMAVPLPPPKKKSICTLPKVGKK
jgi:hypothetical protein